MWGNHDFISYFLYCRDNCWGSPIHLAYGASYPYLRALLISATVETRSGVAENHSYVGFFIPLSIRIISEVPPTVPTFPFLAIPLFVEAAVGSNRNWAIFRMIKTFLGCIRSRLGASRLSSLSIAGLTLIPVAEFWLSNLWKPYWQLLIARWVEFVWSSLLLPFALSSGVRQAFGGICPYPVKPRLHLLLPYCLSQQPLKGVPATSCSSDLNLPLPVSV